LELPSSCKEKNKNKLPLCLEICLSKHKGLPHPLLRPSCLDDLSCCHCLRWTLKVKLNWRGWCSSICRQTSPLDSENRQVLSASLDLTIMWRLQHTHSPILQVSSASPKPGCLSNAQYQPRKMLTPNITGSLYHLKRTAS
jgi:hypothetical protein